MEHIVQFAIGIDDKAIQNRIEEYAYKDVLDKIVKETMDTVFAHTNAYSRENMRKTMMEEALQSFLEERKDESVRLLRRNDDGLRACNQLLPSHARLFRHHAFRGTQSKRGREGIVMWFKRKYNEYGCPMCGRLPVIKAWQTEKYHESRKVRTTLTVYRLQCPRGHISTSWFSHAALASRQWKELVDEYKGKDTK